MISSKVKGEYKIRIYHPNGNLRLETDWFDNLITNNGLNLLMSLGNRAEVFSYCVLGSGTTTPDVAQTTLTNLQLSTTTVQDSSASWITSPYYLEYLRTYRFAAAASNYNLTEVGIGNSTTSLFSRALLLDGSGNPITVTLTVGEIIDVIYKFRNYPPLTTLTYSQAITIGATEHTFTWKAAQVGVSGYWDIYDTNTQNFYQYLTAYSGSAGIVTSIPSGTAGTEVANTAPAAYVSGSYERSATFTLGLTNSNFAGGIQSFLYRIGFANHFTYQCNVSPAIMKTSSQILTVEAKFSVDRY